MKGKKSRILLVDDEEPIGLLLKAGLGLHGFAVRYESRSTNVLKTCREFHPDLVLLDIDMPVKGGGQVASELRADSALKGIPVIFLSSLVAMDQTRGRNASREMLVSKQIRITELVAILRHALRTFGAKTE
jgi:DNA-binding response OmpR family regulator